MGLRFRSPAARLALIVFPLLVGRGHAQDQGFDALIQGILNQHQDQTPPAQPPPLPPPDTQPQTAPDTPPSGVPVPPGVTAPPAIVPVEPGPRPYTPPKVDHPVGAKPPSHTPVTPSASSTAPAPGATIPTPEAPPGSLPPADQNAIPGATGPDVERTRESLTVEEVNAAVLPAELPPFKGASPLVLKAQVLLDRAGASPGVIDAYAGGNLQKAIAAVETVLGLPADGVLGQAVWDALGGDAAPPVLVQYTITPEDAAYPYVASIPADAMEQSRLPSLGYSSPEEMLGERFHMDTKLLRALNPTADLRQAGTAIWVAGIDATPVTEKVARVVADRALGQLRGYDSGNRLIVAYPATVGSDENPSPIGEHQVSAVTRDPTYEFTATDGSGSVVTLPPGPNNPVGTVSIALTDPGYSIHGAADPAKVGKPAASGGVQLTNWDVEELAGLVEPGVVVSFQ